MASSSFYDDFECDDYDEDDEEEEEEDDDDDDFDDDMIDPESLGDWRNFRRNLAQSEIALSSLDDNNSDGELRIPAITSVSRENEDILSSQNEKLAEEYKNGVWAHEIATVR